MPDNNKVRFFFDGVSLRLDRRRKLKLYLEKMVRRKGRDLVGLNIVFCSDEVLLDMNRSFLGHDYLTDILTFDLSAKRASALEGEIYISADRVRENAKEFGTTLREELHRVIFHGILHLLGQGDHSFVEKAQMRKEEGLHLSEYFNFCST
jgi:rRNA maturation RNase YbeY